MSRKKGSGLGGKPTMGPKTEQQIRIQKLRDELNRPDENDPHAFTRYKVLTYPLVVFFPPIALLRIWGRGTEFCRREQLVQTGLCIMIMVYFVLIVTGIM